MHQTPAAAQPLDPAKLPQPLAEYRRRLERLIEITDQPREDPPCDGVGIDAETRKLLNKEYRTLLQWFDSAAAQPLTQAAALEAEQ